MEKIVEIEVPEALMIYNYNIEMVGDPYRFVKDYEGLLLIGKKTESGE